MATRKEKHQAAVQKREEFLENERRRNADVLRQEKEKRDRKNREHWQTPHDEHHSWKKIDNNCPHCKDLLGNQKHRQRQLEAASG